MINLAPNSRNRLQVAIFLPDPFLNRLYQRRVNRDSAVVVWFDSYDTLKKAVVEFAYDEIVLDLTGQVDALGVLKEIRQLSSQSQVIILNDTRDPRDVVDAFRLGAVDYLIKPVNPETVSWCIGRAQTRPALPMGDLQEMELFRVAHEIRLADSETEMYRLAAQEIKALTHAAGFLWVDGRGLSKVHDDESVARLNSYMKTHPDFWSDGVESDRSGHPEIWFEKGSGWIPLKDRSMGGLLLWETAHLESAMTSRVEYLIRNLEHALENLERYTEAKRLSYIDDLTHSYNARYLALVSADLVQQKRRFSVLFIDIDRFKLVNDAHGHLVGSGLLVQIAKCMKNDLRPTDALFRYGGDEFVVILDSDTREGAVEIAERLRIAVEKNRFQIIGVEVRVTISIGVARFPENGDSEKSILELADSAMYHVKKHGRNSVFSATK